MTNPAYPAVSLRVEPEEPSDNIQFKANLIRGFSADSTAALTLTVTNASESEQTYEFGPTPPFSAYWSDSPANNDAGLILASVDYHARVIPDTPTESGCWRPTGPIFRHSVLSSILLPPAGSVTEKYVLLAESTNTPCLPAGIYRFHSSEPENILIDLSVSVTLEYTQ